MKLIERLRTLQETENLSDAKFARKLNVHRATWIRIRTGETGISTEFLRKVIAVYPGLKKDVEKFLSSNASITSKESAHD